MAQGDLPTPRGGGPFRRRREKRQLEQLAHASKDHLEQAPSTAHVKVVGDQADVVADDDADPEHPDRDPDRGPDPQASGAERASEAPEPGSPAEDNPPARTGGFRVRPVPIDEPIDE
jgi:hypothetical protein